MTEEEILSNPTVQFILQYFEENRERFNITSTPVRYSIEYECRSLMHALFHSLPTEAIEVLWNHNRNEKPKAWYSLLAEIFYPVKKEVCKKSLNTTTELLIKWYTDKKSGKVMRAKKEICKRFNYLDSKDQFKILKLFIAGPLTDRIYAYRVYRRLWDKTAFNTIIDCWKHAANDDEWQRTGLLIIEKASKEQLQELGTALYINAQGQANQRLYSEYCLRFVDEDDFVIEKKYFQNPDMYYEVLLRFQRQTDKDMFEYDLYYQVILLFAEEYYRIYPALIQRKKMSYTQQFHFPHKLDIYGESRELHLCEVYGIRRMLTMAVCFGFKDIVSAFVEYATKVEAAVAQCEGNDCIRPDNKSTFYRIPEKDYHNTIPYFNGRALPLKTYFPEKYMADLLAFEESPVCKQATEDIIALATRTELEEESLRDEIENDKWREVSDFDMYNLGPF